MQKQNSQVLRTDLLNYFPYYTFTTPNWAKELQFSKPKWAKEFKTQLSLGI